MSYLQRSKPAPPGELADDAASGTEPAPAGTGTAPVQDGAVAVRDGAVAVQDSAVAVQDGAAVQEGAAPAAGDARARRRRREHLLALAVPAVVSLAVLGPWILPRMTTGFLSVQPQDGSNFVWMFRWWPYALAHHLDPLYTTAAWAPGGINLAWVASIGLPAIVLTPVTELFGPLASFNVVELAAPVLASWTGYLLCRKVAGAFWPAVLGGLCFGFSPYLMAQVGPGEPNLSLVFLVPLAAWLVLRLADQSLPPRRFVLILGVVLGAQLYISTEIFATMTLVGVVAGAVGVAFGGAAVRRLVLRAAGPVALAYAGGLILASPLLYAAFSRPAPYKPALFTTLAHGARSASDLLGFVIPGRFTILGGQLGGQWGRDGNLLYIGIPLLVLAVIFAVTEWERRRTRLIVITLAVTMVLSLGDSLTVFGAGVLPWRLLGLMPLLGMAQAGRLILYVFLLLAVILSMWLARPGRPRLRWALAALALLAIVPNVTANVWTRQAYVPPVLASGEFRSYLSPGETVWIVDANRNRQMIWQAQTGFYFRLAGGFFGQTPTGLRPPAVQAQLGKGVVKGKTAEPAEIRDFLASHDVGAIIVAEEPHALVHLIASTVGQSGIQSGNVRLFRLTPAPQSAGSSASSGR